MLLRLYRIQWQLTFLKLLMHTHAQNKHIHAHAQESAHRHTHTVAHTVTHTHTHTHTHIYRAFKPNRYCSHLQNSPGEYPHHVFTYCITRSAILSALFKCQYFELRVYSWFIIQCRSSWWTEVVRCEAKNTGLESNQLWCMYVLIPHLTRCGT